MTHDAVPHKQVTDLPGTLLWPDQKGDDNAAPFQPRLMVGGKEAFPALLSDYAGHHHASIAMVRYVVRLAHGTDVCEWQFGTHPAAPEVFGLLESPGARPGLTGTLGGLVYQLQSLEVGDELRGMILLGWDLPDQGHSITSTAPHLALFLLQAHRLHEAEQTRQVWLSSVRHQAILSESLEWLTELETEILAGKERTSLYEGLLRRARLLCNAEAAALALYRDNGSCYHWIPLGLTPDMLDKHMAGDTSGVCGSLMEYPVITSKGQRARIYLTRPGDQEFAQQDQAYVAQLSNQAFRTIEKLELMEDLQLSNQFLAMERQDQEQLIRELKETQQQLLHSEKLASIGQLAAGVAHEINNPVSFVSSNLYYLQNSLQEISEAMNLYQAQAESSGQKPLLNPKDWPELRDELNDIITESRDGIERVRQIVLDLKNFSRVGETSWQLTDLHQCIESTLNIVRNEIKYKAEIVKQYGEIPLIQCASSQINQVIMNLIVNAAQAIPEKGVITITTGKANEMVFFSVADTGHGIKPDHLRKIFDPFFTTKPVGKGTGLGLSLSFGIIKKHHGRIEVESEPGKGTRFTVWLPVAQDEAESP